MNIKTFHIYRFAQHAENVYLLNYILRNDVKWRVTETMIFNLFDVTGGEGNPEPLLFFF
jgi:hypothetical protein